MEKKATIIGAAVLDVYAGAVDKELFTKGSVSAPNMGTSCGGDALNEAVFLSGLGVETKLVTLLGGEEASQIILKCLNDNKISTDMITVSDDIVTGVNIVLVDSEGERYFITNPDSSLRKLSREHILPHINDMGDIVSFASIFVSPRLTIRDMADVFCAIKEKEGRILVADMTTAKNGEKIEDLEPLFEYVDYIIPNEKEAAILTGESNPELSARVFLEHGAKCVIIKCGKDGCIYDNGVQKGRIPAYPANVVDTTGAGDSFVAGFLFGLSQGKDLPECCRYGCAIASIVVGNMGASKTKIVADDVFKLIAR